MDQKEKNLNNYHSSYLRIFLYFYIFRKIIYILYLKNIIISKTTRWIHDYLVASINYCIEIAKTAVLASEHSQYSLDFEGKDPNNSSSIS
jgi:uncharacterized membrane protein YesL